MAAGQQQTGGGSALSPATPSSLLQQQQQQQQPNAGNLQMQMAAAAAAAAARNGGLNPRMGLPQQMQMQLRPTAQQQQQQHLQMAHHLQQQMALAAARNNAAAAAAAVKMAEAAPAAKRVKLKRKLDKSIPDRIGSLLPESALYSQLLEFESRVDAALARKKVEIQEAVQNPPRYQRTLRMYVFNTFANQVNTHDPHMGFNPGEPPSWTLRIMGRILGDDGLTDSAAARSLPFSKFSSFFKRITVQLDPALYPDSSTIVWDSAKSSSNNSSSVEGFEVKRKGDKELTAAIRLELRYTPDRYKLSPPLAELLGVEVETRARIIAALWHYIKGKKLQNANDPTLVNCDLPLHRILGEERVKFTAISHKLQQHLSAPPPIHLEHRIKLSGKNPAANACYDIMVDVITPLQKEMAAFLANMERHRDIEAYDELIAASIRSINQHRKRRAFFLGFSQSPVEFINGLIASQSRDLKIVNGQASRNADKERRSHFYCQPWVEDAVIRYLNRRTAKMPDSSATATTAVPAAAAAAAAAAIAGLVNNSNNNAS